MGDEYVTKNHCDLVSQNIEEKVDRNYSKIEEIYKLLMSRGNQIDNLRGWSSAIKWVIGIGAGGGIVWKVIDILKTRL